MTGDRLTFVGEVYARGCDFFGHTYGRRVSSGGYESFDGVAVCVGPYASEDDAAGGVREQNECELDRYIALSSTPFDGSGSIPGATELDVGWLMAVARHQPAWLTWGVSHG